MTVITITGEVAEAVRSSAAWAEEVSAVAEAEALVAAASAVEWAAEVVPVHASKRKK